jgi:hypothetical protein
MTEPSAGAVRESHPSRRWRQRHIVAETAQLGRITPFSLSALVSHNPADNLHTKSRNGLSTYTAFPSLLGLLLSSCSQPPYRNILNPALENDPGSSPADKTHRDANPKPATLLLDYRIHHQDPALATHAKPVAHRVPPHIGRSGPLKSWPSSCLMDVCA